MITAKMMDSLLDNFRDTAVVSDFDNLRQVTCTPTPAKILRTAKRFTAPNECYLNCYTLLRVLRMQRVDVSNYRYVVGVAIGASGFPVCHAWLADGDNYFDPSWELHVDNHDLNKTEYHTVAELTLNDLEDYAIEENEYRMPDPAALILLNSQYLNKSA